MKWTVWIFEGGWRIVSSYDDRQMAIRCRNAQRALGTRAVLCTRSSQLYRWLSDNVNKKHWDAYLSATR